MAEQRGVSREAEVVVIGGGPAGIAAAIAAARNGVNTLLVERYGFLGGTGVIICGWAGFQDRDGQQIVGGIGNEIVSRLIEMGASSGHIPKRIGESTTQIEPDSFKYIAQALSLESGCQLLLHSMFSEVELSHGSIRTAVCRQKLAKAVIAGQVFVDCTGDGDVGAAAGCEYEKGRSSDGKMQPVTMTFRVAGFDKTRFIAYLRDSIGDQQTANGEPEFNIAEDYDASAHFHSFKGLDGLIAKVRAESGYELPRDRLHFQGTPNEDVVQLNTSRVLGIDATDADELTKAEITAREQVMAIMRFLKQYVPGFEFGRLVDTSVQVGIRETRRVLGEYVITEEDILNSTRFHDAVAQGIYPLDVHSVDGRGMYLRRIETPYQIPYRSLLARNVRNLLVAGRCLSATHEAQGALRVVSNCMAMGQAAGTAAAISVKNGAYPREIDIHELQATLKQQGVILW